MGRFKKDLLFISIIFLIVILAYWKLSGAFFEQDEWHTFGRCIHLSSLKGLEYWKKVLQSGPLSHFTPLSLFAKMAMLKTFGLNAYPYFILSIVLHGMVSITVYVFLCLLARNKFIAFLGALFFAINSSHHQAITWLGTFEGAQGAVFFGILSLVLFTLYQYNDNRKFLYLSFASVLVGLLFKETAIAFLLVLAVLLFTRKGKRVGLTGIGTVLFLYIVLRFSYFFLGVSDLPSVVGSEQQGFLPTFLYNLLTLPIKIFPQAILPQEFLINFSQNLSEFIIEKRLINVGGPWGDLSCLIYDTLTIVLGLVFFKTFWMVFERSKSKKPLIIGFLLIVFTIFPLFVLKRYLVVLDSRFLYPATFGVSILLASLAKKPAVFFISGLIFLHVISLFLVVNQKVELGQLRKEILASIPSQYPDLPDKTIFFLESDRSYYGLPEKEKIPPFQSGLGQILLVYYDKQENFPREFFEDFFLWEIADEGYKEVGDRGFGYFRDFELMTKIIGEKDIPRESVIAFRYNSETGLLTDMTEEVQGRITSYLLKKKVIPASSLTVYASENNKDISLALDGERNTFWKSELPYKGQQYFRIHLENKKKIVLVRIDSYNDKNQEKAGYRVVLSDNGKDWQQVFYAKSYPPREEGFVDLYFEPQEARYIKIEQIGYHRHASWVVHELEVYEAVD